MACSCHGKRGVAVIKTAPFDQCTTCARKHIVKAWALFNEFTYTDDNRDVMTGQLRAAVDHLMYDHRDLALRVRDLAVMLEEARDAEVGNSWYEILDGVRAAYYTDHPEVKARLDALAARSR